MTDINWNKVAFTLADRAEVHRNNIRIFEESLKDYSGGDTERRRHLVAAIQRESILIEICTDLATALATGTGEPIPPR